MRNRQNCLSEANRFGLSELMSSPEIEKNQKYFAFPEGQIRTISIASRPTQRASAVVTTRGGLRWTLQTATDARSSKRTAKTCGPDVAVLASMLLEATAFRALRRQKSRSPGRARYKP
jgi:hypothetical protein